MIGAVAAAMMEICETRSQKRSNPPRDSENNRKIEREKGSSKMRLVSTEDGEYGMNWGTIVEF